MAQVGRPPKYETPEQMQEAIDRYFQHCDVIGAVPTQEGLSLALGFASRQSLTDYQDRDSFSYIVERAKTQCGEALNQLALRNEINPTIAKLNLTSNYGYSDKQTLDNNVRLPEEISIVGISTAGSAGTDSEAGE